MSAHTAMFEFACIRVYLLNLYACVSIRSNFHRHGILFCQNCVILCNHKPSVGSTHNTHTP
jgi:hypothetical protein